MAIFTTLRGKIHNRGSCHTFCLKIFVFFAFDFWEGCDMLKFRVNVHNVYYVKIEPVKFFFPWKKM